MFGDRWNVGFKLGPRTRGYRDRLSFGFGVSGPFICVMWKEGFTLRGLFNGDVGIDNLKGQGFRDPSSRSWGYIPLPIFLTHLFRV